MSVVFHHIDTVFVNVKNLEEAVDWYTKVLGLSTRWRNDQGGYAAMDAGGLPITFVKVGEEEFKPSEEATFIFYTSDIEAARNKLMEQGVEVGEIELLYDTKWFWFKDPDGNTMRACFY